MRLFVYEHITGGGFLNQPLPVSLAREGELMLQALVNDLTDIPGVEVAVMRDPRLPALDCPVISMIPRCEEEVWAMFRKCMEMADSVWLIAPEQCGTLERLSRMVWDSGKRLMGSHPDAVKVTASKTATARILARNAIPVVNTYSDIADLPADADKIVIKPDDGAGCMNTFLFHDFATAREWWTAHRKQDFYVVQPYVEGDALSLSVLCCAGRAELLSCNRQHILVDNDQLVFAGVDVSAVRDRNGAFARLANDIAAAIPGVWGYVGIDLIQAESGLAVVEVNPRLTTSYAELRRAIGRNPAELILLLPPMTPVPEYATCRQH